MQDGETHTPAVAVPCAEQSDLPHDIGLRNIDCELTMHRLGDDEADVMGKAVREPLLPVRRGIGMRERRLHPDVAIAHRDRARYHVVCPEVEVHPLSRSKRAWCQ